MDDKQRERLLDQVKIFLPQPEQLDETVYNTLVGAALDRTIDSTLNFLNYVCEPLPNRLESLVVAMCVQMVKSNGFLNVGQDNAAGGAVTALTEGDTSISFASPSQVYAAIQTSNPVTSDYVGELYNFRKLPHDIF